LSILWLILSGPDAFFRSNIWMKSTISLAVTKMSVIESLVLLSKGALVYFLPPT
jgi:hypothetical protein